MVSVDTFSLLPQDIRWMIAINNSHSCKLSKESAVHRVNKRTRFSPPHLSVKRSVGDETEPETDKASAAVSGGRWSCSTDGEDDLMLQSYNSLTAGGLNKCVFVCRRSSLCFLIVPLSIAWNQWGKTYSLLSCVFGLLQWLCTNSRLNGVDLKTH